MIYVGIDDTDVKGSPGTNQIVRSLIHALAGDYPCVVALRHQLLFDPRVPYTSKNSSASVLFESGGSVLVDALAAELRRGLQERFVEGSDPGLCVTEQVPDEIRQFGRRCQEEVVGQREARRLASAHGIRLEGLGGTEDGVIGALAAVGLAAGGEDGRVVQIAAWPDDLAGPQDVALLHARGVAEVRCVASGEVVSGGTVDVGKHLRPNYRGGRIVLFVASLPEDEAEIASWRALRFT